MLLGTAWFSPFDDLLIDGGGAAVEPSQSSRLSQPCSLSHSHRAGAPAPFVAFYWTYSVLSMSTLAWESQDWMQYLDVVPRVLASGGMIASFGRWLGICYYNPGCWWSSLLPQHSTSSWSACWLIWALGVFRQRLVFQPGVFLPGTGLFLCPCSIAWGSCCPLLRSV